MVDTSQYKEEVTGAAEIHYRGRHRKLNQAAEITDVNFMAMGASATAAYGTMQTDAETAWSAMQTAATTGTDAIVAQFPVSRRRPVKRATPQCPDRSAASRTTPEARITLRAVPRG